MVASIVVVAADDKFAQMCVAESDGKQIVHEVDKIGIGLMGGFGIIVVDFEREIGGGR